MFVKMSIHILYIFIYMYLHVCLCWEIGKECYVSILGFSTGVDEDMSKQASRHKVKELKFKSEKQLKEISKL
jgi:hypothetical protein